MYFRFFWFRTLLTWIFRTGSAKVPHHLREDGIELLSFSFMFMQALGHTTSRHENCTATDTLSQKNWQLATTTAFEILKVIMYSDSNAHSRPTTTVKCDILNLTQSGSSTSILLPVDSTTDSKFQLGERQCHDVRDRKQTSTTTTKLSNDHAVKWQLTGGPTVQ